MSTDAHLTALRRGPAGPPVGEGRELSIAFVIPFGEPEPGFFPDTLLEHACAAVLRRGHHARVLRVYYDGRDPSADARVRERLGAWLEERAPDLIVVERLFDPGPFLDYRAAHPEVEVVLVSWGDTDLTPGIDLLVGLTPGRGRGGRTRRSPSAGELVASVVELVDARSRGGGIEAIAGLARVIDGRLEPGPTPAARPLPRPIRPTLDHDVIAPGAPPVLQRRHLFGNAGCPFAADPRHNPFYEGIQWPEGEQLSQLGCAFCHAGGDYQKRPTDAVVAELVEQAVHYTSNLPEVRELVLVDQYPVRYLQRLLRAAKAAGVPPVRWLFQARADGFTKDREHVRAAARLAMELGDRLEVYLSGFESFSDRELERYNKGVDADELAQAVGWMRSLAQETEGAFDYARARGHSMILWSPWTEPRDVVDNVRQVRRHGLMELFDEIGRNRLRLYRDLPIYWAAERDGLLLDTWAEGDEGAGRRKGYSVEHPWRFADARTGLAYGLATDLREHLGRETEVDQLAAVAAYCETRHDPSLRATILAQVRALEDALSTYVGGERPAAEPPSAGADHLVAVPLGGPCNNGCAACPNRDRWRARDLPSITRRIEDARGAGRCVNLTGREPTMHPDFMTLVRAAAGGDGRPVATVTNARRFSVPGFAAAAYEAGLRLASVKMFAPHEATHDAIARDPGAYRQAGRGALALGAAGVRVELRAPVHRNNLEQLVDHVALARRLDATGIRLEVSLAAIGLDRLDAAREAVLRVASGCARAGVRLDASPLASGSRGWARGNVGG